MNFQLEIAPVVIVSVLSTYTSWLSPSARRYGSAGGPAEGRAAPEPRRLLRGAGGRAVAAAAALPLLLLLLHQEGQRWAHLGIPFPYVINWTL